MRVLVVEDDKNISYFIRQGLEAQGFGVDLAHEGNKGHEMAESGIYDLLILDIMMPGMDGFEILKRLREEKMSLPVLLLTAKDGVDDKVKGLKEGADDYLAKPFAFMELSARVEALLRRGTAYVETEKLKVADLVMNIKEREVTRNGKPLQLTTQEFNLLEYLMRNPNRALSRNMIQEKVWGYDFDSFSNVVDVYIRYLRQKIDEDHEIKLIETVRGVGYKIRGVS